MSYSRTMWQVGAGAALAGLLATAALGQDTQPPVTTVAPVTVTARPKLPEVGSGSNYYTPEQLRKVEQSVRVDRLRDQNDQRRCGGPRFVIPGDISRFNGSMTNAIAAAYDMEIAAREAARATDHAIAVLAKQEAGEASAADLVEAELARQSAVNRFDIARRTSANMEARIIRAQNDLAPGASSLEEQALLQEGGDSGVPGMYRVAIFADLGLTDLKVREYEEAGERVMEFTGRVVNTRRRPITFPPLWFAAVDNVGFPVKMEIVDPALRIPMRPGESRPFVHRFKPMPARSVRGVITFAPEGGTMRRAISVCAGSTTPSRAPTARGLR